MAEPFHEAMDAILTGTPDALDPWLRGGEAGRAGLAVYRNTVAKARVDALAAHYPTVARLVGEAWFREAALIFARAEPPTSPMMDDFGEGFADWLEAFPPAADLPYLAAVARIDRAWSRAHVAADAPVLDVAELSALSPAALFGAKAILHPSVSLFWFDWTVASIWLANRPHQGEPMPVVWDSVAEGLVVVRPEMEVRHHRLLHAQWQFLDACRRGLPLGRAAANVRLAYPLTDLSRLFAGLLSLGVFTRLEH